MDNLIIIDDPERVSNIDHDKNLGVNTKRFPPNLNKATDRLRALQIVHEHIIPILELILFGHIILENIG
jgi:hypothetical protein